MGSVAPDWVRSAPAPAIPPGPAGFVPRPAAPGPREPQGPYDPTLGFVLSPHSARRFGFGPAELGSGPREWLRSAPASTSILILTILTTRRSGSFCREGWGRPRALGSFRARAQRALALPPRQGGIQGDRVAKERAGGDVDPLLLLS